MNLWENILIILIGGFGLSVVSRLCVRLEWILGWGYFRNGLVWGGNFLEVEFLVIFEILLLLFFFLIVLLLFCLGRREIDWFNKKGFRF